MAQYMERLTFGSNNEFYTDLPNPLVGKSNNCKVYKVRHVKYPQYFALKTFSPKFLHFDQIEIQIKLNHPGILKLYDWFIAQNLVVLVLQYAANGNLFQYIRTGRIKRQQVKSMFKSVLSAVDYLHQNKIMHRDIKPQNILLNQMNEPKLSDFGWSANSLERKTFCGTFQYMAPQLINSSVYNSSVDVWALGILLYQMIQGMAPFKGRSLKEITQSIKKPIAFSKKFNSQEKELIRMMLNRDHKQRPSCKMILANPWLQQNRTQSAMQLYSLRSTREQEEGGESKGCGQQMSCKQCFCRY